MRHSKPWHLSKPSEKILEADEDGFPENFGLVKGRFYLKPNIVPNASIKVELLVLLRYLVVQVSNDSKIPVKPMKTTENPEITCTVY